MGEFLALAFGLPTMPLTVLVLAVFGFWLFTIFGLADSESLDGLAVAGVLAGFGLGHVPVMVALSVFILFSWALTLMGSSYLEALDAPGWLLAVLAFVVLAIALLLAWAATWLVVLGLRRVIRTERTATRKDFVGRVCVVRTGSVDQSFGQAEVTAEDGSSAIIQVRQNGDDPLTSGDTALIFDYDAEGEFYWVSPYDAALDPHRPIE